MLRAITGVVLGLLLGSPARAADEPKEEPTRHDKVYFLQHRLLPRWTFESEGAFFADAAAGEVTQLTDAAAKLVDEAFAKGVAVSRVAGGEGVLISFPPPAEPPECYFVLIVRREKTFEYITLERTEDILGRGAKSVVGAWTREGSHLNHGSRTYSDAGSFLAEVLSEPGVVERGADNMKEAPRGREED